MSKLIEITIPVLNEELTLIEQVRKAHDFIHSNLKDMGLIKLILADNGSIDETSKIAKAIAKELPHVEYLYIEERGVGRALKASWNKSEADIIGYMDLDLATDMKYLRPALEKLTLRKADIVTGSRLGKGAKVIGRSFLRGFISSCFNYIVKLFFKTSFSDGMCGFKFLRRSIVSKLMASGACSDGWFFATELLIVGEYRKYKVVDLPVTWTDAPNSKVKIIKLTIEYLKAMRILWKRLDQLDKEI